MSKTLTIGPLQGGGLVLGYRCPSRCRHCLYDAGPERRDGLPESPEALEALLDLLVQRGPRARYHIGGGEPFLDLALLGRAVAGMTQRGLALDYVETNAAWVKDGDHAQGVLAELREQGLHCVLVSLSPFHAEFIPLDKTLALIEAAERTLPGGAFVWIPGLLEDIRAAPAGRGGRIDLEALLARRGPRYARQLAARYSVVPAGRAGRFLFAHEQRRPWREAAAGHRCTSRLRDTTHFHVDGQGRYVPGLCAGIVLPLAEVPGQIDLSRYPSLRALVSGGPAALVALARAEAGFLPDESYAGACDLCTEVRRHLHAHDSAAYPELGPPGFYGDHGA
jgi:hypothetical protein